MGNTGSVHVIDVILSYIGFPVSDIQIAAIRALLKFTHLEQVANSLADLLEMDLDEEMVILITHTLIKGHRYSTDQDIRIAPEVVHPLIRNLISAVWQFNNTDLIEIVAAYIHEVGGEQVSSLLADLETRFRRGTTYWASSQSSDYNIIASLSSRQQDIATYPQHKAYIWAKRLGISKAYLQTVTGVFFGRSNDCDYIKGYAKVLARYKLLSRTGTLANVEVLLQKQPYSINGRLYAQIGGNTLVNRNLFISRPYQCSTYSTPLTRNRYRLFSFSYSIFVYVGTVSVGVHVDFGASVSFNAQLCSSLSVYNIASGSAGLIPQINLYAGGSARVTLLVRKINTIVILYLKHNIIFVTDWQITH